MKPDVKTQERHHRRRSFKDEYLACLKKFEIPFEEKYVFKFIAEHILLLKELERSR